MATSTSYSTDSYSTENVIKVLSGIDRLAEEIIGDKHEIIHLDAKRNKCREARRRLQEQSTNKSWVCFGNTFIKMDTKDTLSMLEKDQESIDKEINRLRDALKPKVNDLHKMEGRPEIKGFQLSAIKSEDLLLDNS